RWERLRDESREFYARVDALQEPAPAATRFTALAALAASNRTMHEQRAQEVYRSARGDALDDLEISTLLNVNRELYASNKALLSALKDFLLPAQAAEELSALPDMA